MKYAVFSQGGKQYKVNLGEEVLMDHFEGTEQVEFNDVLLVVDGEQINIGTPSLSNAKVVAQVLQQEKGKKIHIIKFKAKSRYRRKSGFRPQYTRVKIQNILLS